MSTTDSAAAGKARYAWATLTPLAWLITVTMTAGWQLVFSGNPTLGLLARATAVDRGDPSAAQRIFNYRLDVFVALLFMTVVVMLLAVSIREWWLVLSKRKPAVVHETPFVESLYAEN